jgi:tetratricopeptide (TPR) repeat protein
MFFQYLTLRRTALRAGLFLLALPLLISVVGCGTQAQNSLKVQEDLDESLRHAQVDANDTQARQWADRAIAVSPQDPATYFGSLTPAPNDPLPQLNVAAVFAAVGDNPALAAYMTQAVQKFPDDERGYLLLAQTQGELGQTPAQKATAATLAALLTKKLHMPGATDIESLTVSLAQAQVDSGDAAGGAATYQKAIQAYPTDPTPPNNLAYEYAVSGTHLPEALALAQKAILLAQKKGVTDEEIAGYSDTLGWVQYQQGKYPAAEQNLLQAADALPRLAEVRYHLGLVYIAEDKMDAARAELGHAVLLSQGYAAAKQALGSLPKSETPSV